MNNRNKKGNFVSLLLLLISVFLLVVTLYYLYINLPGEPISVNIQIDEPDSVEVTSLSRVKQFYPNMKFNHNEITYNIDFQCDEIKKSRVLEAFSILSENVDSIRFVPTNGESDIEVSCTQREKNIGNSEYFVAGEGGAKEIIQTGKYNVINEGIILLYNNVHNAKSCNWPNVELHELLHVFGFNHSSDDRSIMYPLLESCDQSLDESIVKELKRLYDIPNLADLDFEEASATKKGIYLDFNISIRNSGTVDSRNTTLSIYDDDTLVDTRTLEGIKYGAGVMINVENFRLNKRNSKEIKFVIDKYDNIKEIDEDNNEIIAIF